MVDIPTMEEANERVALIEARLLSETDPFFANYALEGMPEVAEPLRGRIDILGYACIYSAGNPEATAYILLGLKLDQLPPREELRRIILGLRVPEQTAREQAPLQRLWGTAPGRAMLTDRVRDHTEAAGLPIAFVAFARTEHDDTLRGFLFHPPVMPSEGALDLVREAVERAVAGT
jgi:hypothetical protein